MSVTRRPRHRLALDWQLLFLTYPLGEVQFPRPVEPEDGVEVSRGPIEIVLAAAVREVVAELLDTYDWADGRAMK